MDQHEHRVYYDVEPDSVNDDKIPQTRAAQMGIVPKHPFRMVITGGSGSGKTTLACHLLAKAYKDYFDVIKMFSPTAKWDPSWRACKFEEGDIEEDLDPDMLYDIYQEAEKECKEEGAAESKRILLMFDDCISDRKFMRSAEMLKLFVQGRHCNISLMMLTQSYMKVDRSCRLQASDIFFFPSNMSEVERLVKEHCPPNVSNNEFRRLVQYATSERYNFLSILRRNPPEERFRKNLDTVLEVGGINRRALPDPEENEQVDEEDAH
jgi:hypothetical protein